MPPVAEERLLDEYMHGEEGYVKSLNSLQGDVEIRFKASKPEDVERAKQLVEDAMKAGYGVMVKDKLGRARRITKFDPKRERYIIGKKGDVEHGEVPMREAKAVTTSRPAGG